MKLRTAVSRPVYLGVRFPSEPMTIFLFSVRQLRVSSCEVPSLTRGLVCNLLLQYLLGHARAVTLGVQVLQNSRPYFTASFETLPNWRAWSPYSYPLGTGCLAIPTGTGFPFRRLLRLAGSIPIRLQWLGHLSCHSLKTESLENKDQPVNIVWGNNHCLF
jgi:hypothetical protein